MEPITSADFYRAVVQAVLLFGAETWVLSASMEKRVVGFQTGVLQKLVVKRAMRRWDRTCRWEGGESVLKAAGTQDIWTYIDRYQVTVAQWVALRTIF